MVEKFEIEVGKVPLSLFRDIDRDCSLVQLTMEVRKLKSSPSSVPRELFSKFRYCKFLRLPRSAGIDPTKEFIEISIFSAREALVIVFGILPENPLPPRYTSWSFGNVRKRSDGRDPLR